MKMRDGTQVFDEKLGRLQQFDERSRKFAIAPRVAGLPLKSKGWYVGLTLDQVGGSCVGNSWTHELSSVPMRVKNLTEDFALDVYHSAQQIDQWPETPPEEGTSVLAGVKVLQQRGYYDNYHWGFSLEDALLAIAYEGPVVFGINWYESMFHPDANGVVKIEGNVAGGHAILGAGVRLASRTVRLRNSWGSGWAQQGNCYISFDDLDRLLHEGGECCIPTGRHVL